MFRWRRTVLGKLGGWLFESITAFLTGLCHAPQNVPRVNESLPEAVEPFSVAGSAVLVPRVVALL